MPKNNVSDPITDREIAFAHLILSGTMNDRRAAESAGLNPDTAAYTKAKPRVRAYMSEHRAAVNEKLAVQEADLSRPAVEGLRQLNLGRDQILARLWELANLSHEVTRGIIAGQIKALAMIVAIEGLIPAGTMNDRRLSSPSGTKPSASPVQAQNYDSTSRREQQHQPADADPAHPVTDTKARPAAPRVPQPQPAHQPAPTPANGTLSPSLDPPQPSLLNPFINPVSPNRDPAATGRVFDAILDSGSSLGLSFAPETGFSARRR